MPTRVAGAKGRLVMSTGMTNKSAAEVFKRRVQRLHEAAQVGLGLDQTLMEFVAGLSDRQWEKLIKAGLLKPESTSLCLSVKQHVNDFLSAHRGWSSVHAGNVRRDLEETIEVLRVRRLADFTPERVDSYLASPAPEKSACTRNKRLKHLKQFLDLCVKHERLSKHRLGLIVKADEASDPRRAKRPFTHAEFEALLDHVPRERGRIYLFGVLTGFRRKEIKSLRSYDIDFDRGEVQIPGRMAKNRHDDVLPLHDQLRDVLDAMWEEQGHPPLEDKVFASVPTSRTWKRDLGRAGLEFVDADGRHLYFHSLRTTFTTMLLGLGNTASQAKRATRHRSTKVLEDHYNHLNTDDTRRMIEGLPNFQSSQEAAAPSAAVSQIVAPDVARNDPSPAAADADMQLKVTARRLAGDLLEDMSMVYHGMKDAGWLQGAPPVIRDFRKSFEDLEFGAISSVGQSASFTPKMSQVRVLYRPFDPVDVEGNGSVSHHDLVGPQLRRKKASRRPMMFSQRRTAVSARNTSSNSIKSHGRSG